MTAPLTLAADARLADVLEDAGVRSAGCLGLIRWPATMTSARRSRSARAS
ncbi:MAG: hypothetical protein IPI73_17450 [Betaproteobacteria bacterium]|nr:hypothetical protein [Betaproteobacteria bacterium]